jgi:hypothetical protein
MQLGNSARTRTQQHYCKKGQPLPAGNKKYSWIPRKLLSSALVTSDCTLLVERLLDEVMLSRSFSLEERTNTLVGVYGTLCNVTRRHFVLRLSAYKSHDHFAM